jgi:hypothetical protein
MSVTKKQLEEQITQLKLEKARETLEKHTSQSDALYHREVSNKLMKLISLLEGVKSVDFDVQNLFESVNEGLTVKSFQIGRESELTLVIKL